MTDIPPEPTRPSPWGNLPLRVLFVFALPALLIAFWWLASDGSTDVYWPPLRTILKTFPDVWTRARLRADLVPSLLRLLAGYASAAVVGVALGTVIGSYRKVRAVCEPVLEFLRAVPPPVLVPVIMLFAGIGDTMKIVVIASGCVWPILLNTVEGVRAVDSVMSRRPARTASPDRPGCARSSCRRRARRSSRVCDRRCPSGSS